MIKYVFSDLDNTLLTSDKRVSDNNAKIIEEIQKNGTHFLVSTGRMPFCFEQFEDKLDLSSYSACNGCIVKLDGKTINDVSLKPQDALKLVEYAINKGVYTRIFSYNWLYNLYPEKDTANSFPYLRQSKVSEKEAIKIVKNLRIYKICFNNGDKELLDTIKKELQNSDMEIDPILSGPNFLEVVYKGQSKGSAILKICEYTGTKIEETLAMGDAENDISMLEVAGISACPINSLPEVLEICDYVSDLTCDEDAVSQILLKYVKNA